MDTMIDRFAPVVLGNGAAVLFRGDILHILPALDAGSVDHVVTDPPYSSGGQSRGTRMATTSQKYIVTNKNGGKYSDFLGDNRDQRGYTYWFSLWASFCYRLLRPGGLFLSFTDWRQFPATSDAIQAAGFVWRGAVVWDKTEGSRPDKGRFRHQAEYLLWGSHGPHRPRPNAPCLPGVYRHAVRAVDKHHMAGKPTALMADLLRITNPGDVILDPFMGSGTTGVAAIQSGRRFVGVEQSPAIFDVAVSRINAALSE
ncbi:site-specific DNA-methyltransferase (adenine-specific) [Azospirillum picis]|uniref:Methyltransferase n=2 Tax=Azospirillum picis TaxID=488438 RepID=A0ABU0MNT7_9PROT|nr:site-specific DNA-methyltransferase (adenine-specific) [Azospirillum picis]MDQ0535130.1 site-specific DNA-methyltransferase (adenine-specific) [Azospirillum picis]